MRSDHAAARQKLDFKRKQKPSCLQSRLARKPPLQLENFVILTALAEISASILKPNFSVAFLCDCFATAGIQMLPFKFNAISDRSRPLALCAAIRPFGCTNVVPLHSLDAQTTLPGEVTLFDIDLNNQRSVDAVRAVNFSLLASSIFLVTDKDRDIVQANALGAKELLRRPLDAAMLKRALQKLGPSTSPPQLSIDEAERGLDSIFDSARKGEPINFGLVDSSADFVDNALQGASDFCRWIDVVRQHHSATYQHCLLVAGTVGALSRHVGFSANDRRRVGRAALVHDIGKAHIPTAILDKPGPLNAQEIQIMRGHANEGVKLLLRYHAGEQDLLDGAGKHHEMLDGSGYPMGCRGADLSDMARLLTISDIYASLIESRPYKRMFSGQEAYDVLVGMGSKLDQDLVSAFRPVALLLDANAAVDPKSF